MALENDALQKDYESYKAAAACKFIELPEVEGKAAACTHPKLQHRASRPCLLISAIPCPITMKFEAPKE